MIKKILFIFLLIIFLLISAILVFTPDYATKYINENGKELTKRKIHIDNFDLNLFTGKTNITNFKMYEDDDSSIFVQFDTLLIEIDLKKILSNEIYIQEVKLDNPVINLTLKDGTFNFSSLASTDSTEVESTDKDTTSTNFTFSLNNLSINSGEFNYSNIDEKIDHDVEDFDLLLKHIAFDNTTAKMGLEFKLDQGGVIKTDIAFNTKNNDYDLDVNIDRLNLNEFLPYLQKDINLKEMEGNLYSSLNIVGNASNIGEPVIKGVIGVKDFKLVDNKDLDFFEFTELRIKSKELNLKDMNFVADTILIDGIGAKFEMYNNSTSVDRLFYKDTKKIVKEKAQQVAEIADSLKGEKSVSWEVKHLVLKNTKAKFTDYSLKPDRFSYNLTNVSLIGNDIRFGKDVMLKFKSTTPKGGRINADITTDPGNPTNGTFNIYTKNVDTRDLSPFFVNYFAYPITRGKFNFSFRSKVQNKHLDSRIIIDMYSFKLGEKRKDVEPQSSLPIKTALVIATDKNKRINFDVNAKGDIDDPNFKIGKIVFNTIMKNLGKIIVSPGRLLSKGVGIDEDEIKKVYFDEVQYKLGPAQLTQLDVISELLQEKNPLSARIEIHVNKKDEIVETAIRRAKIKYFLKQKYNNDELFSKFDDNDNLAINDIETDDEGFGNYLRKNTKGRNLSNKEMCIALFTEKELNSLYSQLNEARINNIKEYLSKKEGVLFKIVDDIKSDNSTSEPYAHFEYFIEGEESNSETKNIEE